MAVWVVVVIGLAAFWVGTSFGVMTMALLNCSDDGETYLYEAITETEGAWREASGSDGARDDGETS